MPVTEELADGAAAVPDQAREGRRERRRREIRGRLYETAIELFLEQGFERTTMDEIANRADVARTTVFNHYPRKTEFLSEWGAQRRAWVGKALLERHLNDKPLDVILESYMNLLTELNLQTRAVTKQLMPAAIAYDNSLRNPPLAQTLADYIRRAQTDGQVRPERDPGQAGLTLAAAYFATVTGWCSEEPAPFDLGKALSQVVQLVLHGLAAST